jgi:hypothetical protein
MVHDDSDGIAIFAKHFMQIIVLDLGDGHLSQRFVSLVFGFDGFDYHFVSPGHSNKLLTGSQFFGWSSGSQSRRDAMIIA